MSVRLYLDTSAVAKLYLEESGSSKFRSFLENRVTSPVVSTLTRLELRCLLSRRRRAGSIDFATEQLAAAKFENLVGTQTVVLFPVEDSHVRSAIDLLATMPAHPLRTLDALHLAIARSLQADAIATADRTMGKAAAELRFGVEFFA